MKEISIYDIVCHFFSFAYCVYGSPILRHVLILIPWDCQLVHHTLFLHSSFGGQLECFYSVAGVNIATMDIPVCFRGDIMFLFSWADLQQNYWNCHSFLIFGENYTDLYKMELQYQILKIFFFPLFVFMGVLSACMYGHYVSAWYSQRLEEPTAGFGVTESY